MMVVQLCPIIVILFFALKFRGTTENAGWILDKETGCKFYTLTNSENRSFTWSGGCVDGFAHGNGNLILLEWGYRYYTFEGSLSMGKMEGKGTTVMLDGDTYEGNYANGMYNGHGRLYNDEGDYYEGNFSDGVKSGQGTYWYTPNSQFLKYAGAWKNGDRSGVGTLHYRNGKKVTETFKDGKLIQSVLID